MAAHRYWRVYLNATAVGDPFFSVAELHVSETVGGANIAASATITYAGTLWSGSVANLVDNNPGTVFILRQTTQCYYDLDFGAGNAKDLNEIGFMCRSDGFFYQIPQGGTLAYSDNASTYTDLFGWSVGYWTYVSEMRKLSAAALTGVRFDWQKKTASVKLLTSARLTATFVAVSTVSANEVCQGLNYAEFTITTLTGTPAVGLANSSYSYSVGTLLGADANSLGYRSNGAVVSNGVTLATIATFAAGNRVDVAYNPKTQFIWFRVNGGNWNNSGTADPATNTGGIAVPITSTNPVAISPRFSCGASITGTVIDAAFDTFVGTPPTGYSSVSNLNSLAYSTDGVETDPDIWPEGDGLPNEEVVEYNLTGLFYGPGPNKYVSGTIMEEGVTVPNKRVKVYDRDTGELLGMTTSAGDGTWTLGTVGRSNVLVVADDPTTYNSLVYDNVPAA